MQDLIKQEQFELEVLDRLNSGKFLNDLVLGGGTMLRLCHGLDRFSVDLDFWLVRNIEQRRLFSRLKEYLGRFYRITDAASKSNTLLFELKSPAYPRRLKIEIRKEMKKVKTEAVIAYSPHSETQVLLKTVTLPEMMKAKIEAFNDRKEIRDAFDLEFLLKKGIPLPGEPQALSQTLKNLDSLTKQDYTNKLGSLLEAKKRSYFLAEKLKILRQALMERLA